MGFVMHRWNEGEHLSEPKALYRYLAARDVLSTRMVYVWPRHLGDSRY